MIVICVVLRPPTPRQRDAVLQIAEADIAAGVQLRNLRLEEQWQAVDSFCRIRAAKIIQRAYWGHLVKKRNHKRKKRKKKGGQKQPNGKKQGGPTDLKRKVKGKAPQ